MIVTLSRFVRAALLSAQRATCEETETKNKLNKIATLRIVLKLV